MVNYILLKTGIKDLYFYYYIWRFIRKNRDGDTWKSFNLRHDWIGRIYTVYTTKNEDTSLPDDINFAMMVDQMQPLISWLEKNNMGEIMMPDIKRIPDSYSYLVKFSPLFYEISLSWLFTRSILIGALYFIYPYIKNLIQYVSE